MRLSPLLLAGLVLGAIPALTLAEGGVLPGTPPAHNPVAPTLPNVLNCQALSWMKNCTEINSAAQQNPSAPIRVYDPDGLEFNFAPGTPSAVITYALTPNVDTAKALWHYYEKQAYRADYEAALMTRVINEEGGYHGILAKAQAQPDTNAMRGVAGTVELRTPGVSSPTQAVAVLNPTAYKKVKMFVFYDSHCKWCNQLAPELATLHKTHPELQISLLQINSDQHGVERFAALTQLPTHELDGPYAGQMRSMVKGTPTIWLQDLDKHNTSIVPGYQTLPQLEQDIQEAAQ